MSERSERLTGPEGRGTLVSGLLLKCTRCETLYDVDDAVMAEAGVVVECEACAVPLAIVEKSAPDHQDEKTAMLAAFDPDELERLRPTAPTKPPAPAAPAAPPRATEPPGPALVDPENELPTEAFATARTPAPTDALGLDDLVAAAERSPKHRPTPEAPPPTVPLQPAVPKKPPRRAASPPPEPAARRAPVPAPTEAVRTLPKGPPDPTEAVRLPPAYETPEPARVDLPPEPPRPPILGIIVLLVAVLGLLGGTGYLFYKVSKGETAAAAKVAPSKPRKVSFRGQMSLFLTRTNALLASIPSTEDPVESLPILVTQEEILVRTDSAIELNDGKVRRKDRKGLLIPSLLPVLMRERSPEAAPKAAPPPAEEGDEAAAPAPAKPVPVGRGASAILLLAEASVPFETIARVLYTAESSGYKHFLLGGVQDRNPSAIGAVAIRGLEWWTIGPDVAGRGLGVVADSATGFVVFLRDGGKLSEDGDEKRAIEISKGAEFSTDRLADRLMKVRDQQPEVKRVTVQPDGGVGFETLLSILVSVRGEDGDLFEQPWLGGGGLP